MKNKAIIIVTVVITVLVIGAGFLVHYLLKDRTADNKTDNSRTELTEDEINALLHEDVKNTEVKNETADKTSVPTDNTGDAGAIVITGTILPPGEESDDGEEHYMTKEELAATYTIDHPDENGGYYIDDGDFYVNKDGEVIDMRGDAGYEDDYIGYDEQIWPAPYAKGDHDFIVSFTELAATVAEETGVHSGTLIAFGLMKSMQGTLDTVDLINNPYLLPAKKGEASVPLTVNYIDSWASVMRTESEDFKVYASIEDSIRDFADYIKYRINCEDPMNAVTVLNALIADGYYYKENFAEALEKTTMWDR